MFCLFVVLLYLLDIAEVLPGLSVVALRTLSLGTLRLLVVAIPSLRHNLALLIPHAVHQVICSLDSTANRFNILVKDNRAKI